MCDFSKGFKLCTCNDPSVVVHNKNSRRHKRKNGGKKAREYIWELHHYVGEIEISEMGFYNMPYEDIGKGLTAEFVLKELNRNNCFDFEYRPKEGDNLSIRIKDSIYSMDFIFRNNEWILEHYSPFYVETQRFLNGTVQVDNKLTNE